MKTVFAFWDSTPAAPARQAELVALFHRGCVKQGYTPRLLTAKDAYKSSRYRKDVQLGVIYSCELFSYALHAKKGKNIVHLRAFLPCL